MIPVAFLPNFVMLKIGRMVYIKIETIRDSVGNIVGSLIAEYAQQKESGHWKHTPRNEVHLVYPFTPVRQVREIMRNTDSETVHLYEEPNNNTRKVS